MCQISSQPFFPLPILTFLILCSLSKKRFFFSDGPSLVGFGGKFGKASEAPEVQQFSFQGDGIKKLAVPDWLQGLVRPMASWHLPVTDQAPLNSIVRAAAKMTFKETLSLFLWFKEGTSSLQGFCFASGTACIYNASSASAKPRLRRVLKSDGPSEYADIIISYAH